MAAVYDAMIDGRPTRWLRGAALAVLLLWAGPRPGQAQPATPAAAASLALAAPTDSAAPVAPVRRRVGFVIGLDNRQSFVQASAVTIIGLNAGIVLPNRRWRLGLGGYTLRGSYADLYVAQVKSGKRPRKTLDNVTPQLDLTYVTPNVSYVFLQRRWLELSLPAGLGVGRSRYYETDANGQAQNNVRGFFFPAEAGLNVLVKPFRWWGVSGSVGYRKSLFEVNYKEDFDGMYFSYRFNVFIGAIWRDWRAYRLRHHPAGR